MTDDGAFRVLTVVTTDTVSQAVAAQGVRGKTAEWLGELITGAALVREAMAPDRRVQILVKDSRGRTRLVADAHPRGWNRGIVNPGAEPGAELEENAVMEVIYTLPNDVLQQGIVQLPDGADVSVALMTYLQESEQVTSMLTVHTIVDHETTVRAAGGYLVQLLPGASRAALAQMTQRLTEFDRLIAVLSEASLSADLLRSELIGDIPVREMARTFLTFGCNCDRGRILAGVASLPADDLADLTKSAESLEVKCESCGRTYHIEPAELAALARNKRTPSAADAADSN